MLGLIADHRRNRPGQRGREMRVVVGHRVDDEPVDRGAGHRQHVLGVRSRRHQQQPDPGLVALQGQPLQERDGARVPERVGHLLGEQQPDRAGLAGAQRAGHRVRARVAHPPRRFHHPGPQLRRQLVGTVVGVGHRGPGDAQLGRERRQRCRRPRPWWAIHHPCTVSGGCRAKQPGACSHGRHALSGHPTPSPSASVAGRPRPVVRTGDPLRRSENVFPTPSHRCRESLRCCGPTPPHIDPGTLRGEEKDVTHG